LEQIQAKHASAGEIVGLSGFEDVFIGETLTDREERTPLQFVDIDPPTIRMRILVNDSPFGNTSSIFTTSGKSAREYAHRVEAGMIGVNIGVAAPMAFFPFSGWKQSFFGDLHAHGKDAVSFYTEQKVIMTRWF